MRYSKRRNRTANNNSEPVVRSSALGVAATWQPKFYIQTQDNDYTNSVWSLTNVFPMIYVNIIDNSLGGPAPGYPVRANTLSGSAQHAADWVEYRVSGLLRDQGRIITDYTFQLQGYGCNTGNYPSTPIFANASDGFRGAWNATGIANYAAWTYSFVNAFKAQLDARSLPYPTRLDMDVECHLDLSGIAQLLTDPRASGRLIDGRHTLQYYWELNDGKTPLGDAIVENEFPGSYDWAYQWWARNIWTLVGDYSLQEGCYKYFASGFPGIKTSNFDYFCGTLSDQGFRDKDFHSSHYLVSGLYATDQNAVNYAVAFIDLIDPTWDDVLYGTFNNCLEYYGVVNEGNIDDVLTDLYIEKCRFQCESLFQANPNRPISIYHWYQPTGMFFSNSYVPPSGGALIIDQELMLNQFRAYGNSHVDTILLFHFESTVPSEINNAWYYAISNLSGFHNRISTSPGKQFPIAAGLTPATPEFQP